MGPAVNFLIVPLVVAAMFTLLPADQAVRIGVLLVLLIGQMLLLRLFLYAFLGSGLGDSSMPARSCARSCS